MSTTYTEDEDDNFSIDIQLEFPLMRVALPKVTKFMLESKLCLYYGPICLPIYPILNLPKCTAEQWV
jgi:hypothetical protein